MTIVTLNEVCSKLETKLNSNLPLTKKCQLAVNILNRPVFIPGKEDLVLSWILKTLDKKYNDRLSKSVDDQEDLVLWRTLLSCLTLLETRDTVIVWSVVAETLTNVIPYSDLNQPSVLDCIIKLLTMSCESRSGHSVMWACVITALLSHFYQLIIKSDSLLSLIYKILENLEIDVNQDYSEFIISMSFLYNEYKHENVKKIVARLLFPTSDPYFQLFSHLSSSEGKYQPGHVVSLLLSVVSNPITCPLIMATCPSHPDWLRPKVFSLLLSSHGHPGIVDKNSVLGAQILSKSSKESLPVGALFHEALPLNLDFKFSPENELGQFLQNVVKIIFTGDGINSNNSKIIYSMHLHHPHLLEPVLGLIMEKRLRNEDEEFDKVFLCLLDVVTKMRQLPKLISKLFLHLRGVESKSGLKWMEQDLCALGDAITSLPKVQCLEIWKCLNYHLSADVLQAETQVLAPVIGPLMSSVLTNVHIVDHNTPSTLMTRVSDLITSTLKNLQEVKALANTPTLMRTLLFETTEALHKLALIVNNYRSLGCVKEVSDFARGVGKMVGNNADTTGNYLGLNFQLEAKTNDLSKEHFPALSEALEKDPTLIEEISEKVLLNFIKSSHTLPSSLNESAKFCSILLYYLLGKLNKEENLNIPDLENWRGENLHSLESYLAKCLSQSIITLSHSNENFKYELPDKGWSMFSSLPIEYLPSTLKLAATLVCLTAFYNNMDDRKYELLARCLENTDLFRYIDAGMFVVQTIKKNAPNFIVEMVANTAGKYAKCLIDFERNFSEFEHLPTKSALMLFNFLLKAVGKMLMNKGADDDKTKLGISLSNAIGNFGSKAFKKRNAEDKEELSYHCSIAASLQNIFSAHHSESGSFQKYINKVCKLVLEVDVPSWELLIEAIAQNPNNLDSLSLPTEWKVDSIKKLSQNFRKDQEQLLKSLIKCATKHELESIFLHLNQSSIQYLPLWSSIIRAEVETECLEIKKAGLEEAIGNICIYNDSDVNPSQSVELLSSIFTSSPPCVSHQLEVACLDLVSCLTQHNGHQAMSVLSLFLSHRPNLSLSVIPITFSIIRKVLTSAPTSDTLQSLQKVLGLFSRHKADYAPVIPSLLVDLLFYLQSLSLDMRGLLTTSLYPLLEMLEKHSLNYISSNLSPASNELFKVLLENYQATQKFKGKV